VECIHTDRLTLVFANLEDRKTIFEMLHSKETYAYMFDESHPAPTWSEFIEEGHQYYTGQSNPNGSYLLIRFDGQNVGSISYDCGYEKIPYAELDIWLSQRKYMGQGIGTEAIQALIKFIRDTYGIKDFIIRPWMKNRNAISAYKKYGFHESSHYKIEEYYSAQNMESYGEGDYGREETLDLFLKIQ